MFSKNVYIDKLVNIDKEFNNTYHSTIKIDSAAVKASTYIHSTSKEINDKDPKLEFVDFVRISKWKTIFEKSYSSNWLEEKFLIKKVKNTVPWTWY